MAVSLDKTKRSMPREGAGGSASNTKTERPNSRPSNRPRTSSSDESSDDERQGSSDQTAMLAMLQAHSRMMLGIDGPDEAESSTSAQRRNSDSSGASLSGLEAGTDNEDDDDEEDEEEYQSDDGWTGIAEQKVSSSRAAPVEVVFSDPSRSVDTMMSTSKSERRAFLKSSSSKMMGIEATRDYGPKSQRKRIKSGEADSSEGEDDLSNRALDKTLHSMLLTTLIPENTTHARPVEKRNAISARLAQLSSYSLPGESGRSSGSASPALPAEVSRHPAKIRTGIVHARAKREARAAEDERQASHVRGVKKGPKERKGTKRLVIGDAGKKKGMESRKEGRVRGLASGFGKFENGMLKLSEREIARGSGQGRDRGGKSGKKRRY